MFARKVQVEYEQAGEHQPCPLKWLDSFSMRNFTNASIFDDTLPVSDGVMEVGARVPLDQLKDALEDWFRRKSYLRQDAILIVRQSAEAGCQREKDSSGGDGRPFPGKPRSSLSREPPSSF
jgi:hypothetical protein